MNRLHVPLHNPLLKRRRCSGSIFLSGTTHLLNSAFREIGMTRALGPILKTILFTIVAPGTVAGHRPLQDRGRLRATPGSGLLDLAGRSHLLSGSGDLLPLRAWEFAVRGLGTPAPIAPTKFLVTTALHRLRSQSDAYRRGDGHRGRGLRFFSQLSSRGIMQRRDAADRLTCSSSSFMKSPRCSEPSASRTKSTGEDVALRWIPNFRAR